MNLVELELLGQITRGSQKCSNTKININIPHSTRGHYLGMSQIVADPCFLWLEYNKPKGYIPREFGVQVERKLRLGKILEEEIISWIQFGGGILDGQQCTFSDFNGKFRGHNDGIWEYSENKYILEIKTANDSSFNKFLYNELHKSHPMYYGQIQEYMYYSKIYQAIILFYNKNTSDLACKLIDYNNRHAIFLKAKAYAILVAKSPRNIPKNFGKIDCNNCKFKQICDSII